MHVILAHRLLWLYIVYTVVVHRLHCGIALEPYTASLRSCPSVSVVHDCHSAAEYPLDPVTKEYRMDEDLVRVSGKMLVLDRLLAALKDQGRKVTLFTYSFVLRCRFILAC